MAIDNQFGKGIGLAASFDLGAQKPLDARTAVNTIAERDAHVTENRAYEGMIVYVDETKLTYQLVNGEWKEFGFNQADFDDSFEASIADVLQDIADLDAKVGELPEGAEDVVGFVQAQVSAEAQRAQGKEGELAQAVATEKSRAEQAEQGLQQAINTEKGRAQGAEQALAGRLEVIEGEGEGSIKKAVDDAKKAIDADAEKLEGRVKANEDKLAGLTNATVKAEIQAAQAAAEKHADDAISALIDSAPEAMNTLKELAEAIDANKGIYEGWVTEHTTAMNKMKTDLQAEIDADVAAEAKLREDADKALQQAIEKEAQDRAAADQTLTTAVEKAQGEVDALEGIVSTLDKKVEDFKDAYDETISDIQGTNNALTDLVNAETERAIAKESELATAISTETSRAQGAEQALAGRLDALEGDGEGSVKKAIEDEKALREAADQALQQAINDETNINKDGSLAKKIADEISRAKAEETDIREDYAAADLALKQELQDEIDSDVKVVADDLAAKVLTINSAMATMKSDLQSEIDTDVLAEKTRAEEQEAAIRGDMATEAARVNKKIADDIAAESAVRVGAETRIEGLITKEVQDRKDAVQALATRHDEEMDAAEGRIANLEAKFTGNQSVDSKIAAAKQEALNAVAAEQSRAEGQEAAIRGELAKAVEDLQGEIDTDVAAEAALRVAEDTRIAGLVSSEQSRAEGEEARIEGLVTAETSRAEGAEQTLAGRLDTLEGEGAGSVKKAVADAVAAETSRAEGAEQGLAERIQANEAKLAGLEKNTVQAAIDQAEADAKAHAEQKIADLVDSAPEAMNTLNELAAAINANKGIYDGYIAEHATAMNKMKTDLQAEIDADVKVVADELAKQKDANQEGTLAHKIAQESAARQSKDTELTTAVQKAQGEVDTLEGVVSALDKKVEDFKDAYDETISDIQGTNDALTELVNAEAARAIAKESELATAISTEKERAEGVEQGLDARLDVIEGDGAGSIKAAVGAEQSRAKGEEGRIEGKVDTLRADMANVFNALELTGVENQDSVQIQLVLDGGKDMNNVKTPLGSVTLDVLTEAELTAMLDEILKD